jgi:hypothetical protein
VKLSKAVILKPAAALRSTVRRINYYLSTRKPVRLLVKDSRLLADEQCLPFVQHRVVVANECRDPISNTHVWPLKSGITTNVRLHRNVALAGQPAIAREPTFVERSATVCFPVGVHAARHYCDTQSVPHAPCRPRPSWLSPVRSRIAQERPLFTPIETAMSIGKFLRLTLLSRDSGFRC